MIIAWNCYFFGDFKHRITNVVFTFKNYIRNIYILKLYMENILFYEFRFCS